MIDDIIQRMAMIYMKKPEEVEQRFLAQYRKVYKIYPDSEKEYRTRLSIFMTERELKSEKDYS